MADVRIAQVESRSQQIVGTQFPVTVYLNNNELVAPAWNPKTCNGNGGAGHKTDVTVRLIDSAGNTIASKTKEEFCVPRNRAATFIDSNANANFTFTVKQPGQYTIEAEASVIREERTFTANPVTIQITQDASVARTQDTTNTRDTNIGDVAGSRAGSALATFGQEAQAASFIRNNPAVAAGLGIGGIVALRFLLP